MMTRTRTKDHHHHPPNPNPNPNPPNRFLWFVKRKAKSLRSSIPIKLTKVEQSVKVLDIKDKVYTEGERGNHHIIPHPEFLKNRYFYLFYTYDKNGGCKFSPTDGPVNVVSRFKLKNDDNGNGNGNGHIIMTISKWSTRRSYSKAILCHPRYTTAGIWNSGTMDICISRSCYEQLFYIYI